MLGRHPTKSERPAPPFPKSSDNGIIHDDEEEDAQDIDYDHDNDSDSGHDNCHDNDHYFSDHLCIKMSEYDFEYEVKISDQSKVSDNYQCIGSRNKFLKSVISVHYIDQ